MLLHEIGHISWDEEWSSGVVLGLQGAKFDACDEVQGPLLQQGLVSSGMCANKEKT